MDVFQRFFDAIGEQRQQQKLIRVKELYFDGVQVNDNAERIRSSHALRSRREKRS